MRYEYKILAFKSEGGKPLGISRLALEDNIKLDLKEIERENIQ
jgi:hypothetical protein